MQKKPIMSSSFYYNKLRIWYIFVIIMFYDLHDGLLMVYQTCIQFVRRELAQWKSTIIQRSPVRFWAWSHTGVVDHDEVCFMHFTPGVVHNFQKTVDV